jgi:AcrR family transcriptional regulator
MHAMSDNVKRAYRSPRRAEAAQQTRRMIRDAAARLFVGQGVAATTMRQVAAAAGVAERTVYTAFPTKAALFNEVIDIATVGDELPIPVAERDEFTATQSEPDAVRAARQLVDYGCALLERAGDLITAAIESSGADPDMRDFCQRAAAATAANLLTVARAWERNGLLRDGLDSDRAAAMIYALNSPQVHHALRRDQGWDVDRYRDWLTDTILRTVLREHPA